MLLFPLVAVLLFAGVQAALWQHARTVTADRADQIAALVATGDLDPATAETDLAAALAAERDLRNVVVTVTAAGPLAEVAVTADAPGIVLGTTTRIRAHAAVPIEAWQPLP